MRRPLVSLLPVVVGACLATAVPRHHVAAQAPTTTIALTGARLIDGTGRMPLERATLIVGNGRVRAIGAPDAVKIPDGAVRVDLSGKTIIPGIVNAHGHVRISRLSAQKALPARPELVSQLGVYARFGVTTVVSLGSLNTVDERESLKLRDEQEHEALDRARLYTSGIQAFGKTPDEARRDIARLAGLKVDIIKFGLNGQPVDMAPETYGALIDEAHKKGLRTAVHIFYLKDAKGAMDRGADILAHSVRDQDVDAAFIAQMKDRRVGYIPTLTRDLSVFVYETTPPFFNDPFFQRGISAYRREMMLLSDPALQEKTRKSAEAQAIKRALEQATRNLKLLSDAGVTIVMGTDTGGADDAGRWRGYFEHTELEMMVKAGLTPMQALVAATGTAARVMKLETVGTLEPSKWADLVVLNANPLSDIRNTQKIDSVWIAGRRLSDQR